MAECIVDTGPLVGWINRTDQWHAWAVRTLLDLEPPLITCEAVIAETVWHMHSSAEAVDQLYGLIEQGALRVVELLPGHVAHLRALSAKYAPIDCCDTAVIRLSELHPRARVVTTDTRHFKIYRRHRNEPLPLLTPEVTSRGR